MSGLHRRCLISGRLQVVEWLALMTLMVIEVSAMLWSDAPPPTQINVTFWRVTEVAWSPPEDAVYSRLPVSGACHCSHLCLADRRCAAADLVSAGDTQTCQLASRRGGSTDATAAVTAFVRNGRATLGEHCLNSDECWWGATGATCVDGLCACPTPHLTALGTCVISDCSELSSLGVYPSGQYLLQLAHGEPLWEVFCDMETDGGGWTVFQRRQDDPEQIDFYRDWQSYRDGFGNVSGQFWLGNELIHRLTARQPQQLRVDLEDFEGERRFAKYSSFGISDETDDYRLNISGYSGDAGDSLGGYNRHNGHKFSTKDEDNDIYGSSCANIYFGGWWYDRCHISNLNGLYLQGETIEYAKGVVWHTWKQYHYSLKHTEMKIKPSSIAVGS